MPAHEHGVVPAAGRPTDLSDLLALGGEPRPLSVLAGEVSGALVGADVAVDHLAYDSRKVRPGALFFAMPGIHTDGHQHAAGAVAAGARAVVVEHQLPLDVPQVIVPSVQAAIGPMSAAFYGWPTRRLQVVGVTGTNGKTTVCSLLRQCLDRAGVPSGQIGTVGTYYAGRQLRTGLTTPQAPAMHAVLAQMEAHGVRAVAVETSSHGLHQHRVDGIDFGVGVFTNLAREHLDYHGTMERYFEAKALLFEPSRCRFALIGVDDEWGRRLASSVSVPHLTCGHRGHADVRIRERSLGLDGIEVCLDGPDGVVTLRSPLIGRFNASNVAMAYLAAHHLGGGQQALASAMPWIEPPPGRFELIQAGQPFLVVVDYAHTADALEAVVETARELARPGGRVAVVLGARGGRDRGKRPMVGRAAAQGDVVVLTTDSPGPESAADIIEQLREGVVSSGRSVGVFAEEDRRAAIQLAIGQAEPGDVVLVCGRGHELFQHFSDLEVAMDDREAARAALQDAGYDLEAERRTG